MSAELNRAWDAVDKVCELIKGHYQRIEVAGSLRRCKVNPKDGEIVVIPSATLWPRLDELVNAGILSKAKYGLKETFRWNGKNAAYRGVEVDGFKVEIFCAKPETWGYIYWLRTGPGDANQFIMTRMAQSRIRAQGGAIWYAKDWRREGDKWASETKQQVNVSDERVFFGLLGMSYVPPQDRRIEIYEKAIESISHRWGDPANYLMDAPAQSAPAAAVVEDLPNQPRLF